MISILAVQPGLLSIRMLAVIALIAVVLSFLYVIRRGIERTIVNDDMVPEEPGARDSVVLIICAIPIIVVALLLYVVVKT